METRIQLRTPHDDVEAPVIVNDFTWRRGGNFRMEAGPSRHVPGNMDEFLVTTNRGESSAPGVYKPFEEPDLMLDFAKLKTASDVLQFANKFGELGFDNETWRLQYRHLYGPESVMEWLSEAAGVRHVLSIWELIEGNDTAALRRIFQWDGDAVLANLGHGHRVLVANWHHNTEWLPRMKKGDVLTPAKLYLAFQINYRLKGAADVGIRLDSVRKFRPISRPVNLLRGIWIMVSETATGIRKVRPCEKCRELMDVTTHRSHKQMHSRCSLRERMRKYRGKQK